MPCFFSCRSRSVLAKPLEAPDPLATLRTSGEKAGATLDREFDVLIRLIALSAQATRMCWEAASSDVATVYAYSQRWRKGRSRNSANESLKKSRRSPKLKSQQRLPLSKGAKTSGREE